MKRTKAMQGTSPVLYEVTGNILACYMLTDAAYLRDNASRCSDDIVVVL
jgi:hypothetical protein